MKIVKYVAVPDQEVIVDISGEEAVEAICDESQTKSLILMKMAIAQIGEFLRHVPDDMISQLAEKQRELIADFLREQAARFAAPSAPQGGSREGTK